MGLHERPKPIPTTTRDKIADPKPMKPLPKEIELPAIMKPKAEESKGSEIILNSGRTINSKLSRDGILYLIRVQTADAGFIDVELPSLPGGPQNLISVNINQIETIE